MSKHIPTIVITALATYFLMTIFINRPDTYKAEFEELLKNQRKELLDSLVSTEKRLQESTARSARIGKSLKKLDKSIDKYPEKYEKVNSAVGAIADDSLASEFSKEFGQP